MGPSERLFAQAKENVYWRLVRTDVESDYREFSDIVDVATAELFIDQRLKDILNVAVRNVTAYQQWNTKDFRDFIAMAPREALKQLPILTKQLLLERLEEFRNTDFSGAYSKNTSGGSTGKPVSVYQDQRYKRATSATTKITYDLAGAGGSYGMVKLWGAERDLLQGGYGFRQKFLDFLLSRRTINAFVLSPERMTEYVATINQMRPLLIEGYADALFAFAAFIESSGMEVWKPKVVISSAGTLFPDMRQQIEKAFGAKVINRYGCREVGNIAAQCSQCDELHILGCSNWVEILDENGEDVGADGEGDIIITNLFNTVMPIIRYKIGDLGSFSNHHYTCGIPYRKLARVSGRITECLTAENGAKVTPTFFAHLFGVLRKSENIEKFQVVQEQLNHLRVLYVPRDMSSLVSTQQEGEISSVIKRVMGEGCKIEFCVVEDIPKTATGKYEFIKSKLPG